MVAIAPVVAEGCLYRLEHRVRHCLKDGQYCCSSGGGQGGVGFISLRKILSPQAHSLFALIRGRAAFNQLAVRMLCQILTMSRIHAPALEVSRSCAGASGMWTVGGGVKC